MAGAAPGDWLIERRSGSATELHRVEPDRAPARATVRLVSVDQPAVVLGSTQDAAVVSGEAAAAAGLAVVRRRSGGGAVLVGPDEVCWIEALVPAGHARWDDDVARAAHWFGDVWCRALTGLGVDAAVHRGPMAHTAWSRLVCFAGVGPGEVVGDRGKLVGIAQRRTRDLIRLQSAALLRWDWERLLGVLAVADPAPRSELAAAAAPVPADAARIEEAFLAALR